MTELPTQSTAPGVSREPSHVAYSVRETGQGKGFWNRVGVAWSNRDGGFTAQLDLVPLDDRIVCQPADKPAAPSSHPHRGGRHRPDIPLHPERNYPMTTTLTLDLASLLAPKLHHGFRVPAGVTFDDFLDAADDGWDHDLDLDAALARDGKAALVLSADDARTARPHLTDDQAWEVARATRDELRDALGDFLGDVADARFPTGKLLLLQRLWRLKHALRERPDGEARLAELAAVERLLERVLDTAAGNPARLGVVAAALDELERDTTAISAGGDA